MGQLLKARFMTRVIGNALALCIFSFSNPAWALDVYWTVSGKKTLLRQFAASDLKKIKTTTRTEALGKGQEAIRWRGVLFSDLLEEALSSATPAEKSRIDLVLLRTQEGAETPVPRAFVQKYPYLLAFERVGQKTFVEAFSAVPPISSQGKKLEAEIFPYTRYAVESLSAIELTNYRDFYGRAMFLERRSDPLLLLGEKRYYQVCVGCHHSKSSDIPQELARSLFRFRENQTTHEKVSEMPKLGPSDEQALVKFIEEIQKQNRGLARTETP